MQTSQRDKYLYKYQSCVAKSCPFNTANIKQTLTANLCHITKYSYGIKCIGKCFALLETIHLLLGLCFFFAVSDDETAPNTSTENNKTRTRDRIVSFRKDKEIGK